MHEKALNGLKFWFYIFLNFAFVVLSVFFVFLLLFEAPLGGV